MKIAIRLLILGVIASASLLAIATTVQAQSVVLTDQEVERIRNNCQSVKTTLNQLRASDAVLRVNRGQVYESIATNLMEPFNARLNNNHLDSRATTSVIGSYQTARDNFRRDYILYEQQLSAALTIDCQRQPEAFYRAVEEARIRRDTVHTDTQRLNRSIDDYRSAVNDFWLNYQRVEE